MTEVLSVAAEMIALHAEDESIRTVDFMDWAVRIPEPKSGTLDFRRFPFQRELYSDACAREKEVVIQKSTQVGVSAWLARWTMFFADTRGLTALYVFPKARHMFDFSDVRIRPLIQGSDYLRGRVPPGNVQNKGLKRIGAGWVYYRGSESKDELDSVDADVLALDEYDTLNAANIPDAERRISGSQHGYIRRVGVPSIPDYGISKLYNESDRRSWFVRCGSCGLRQPLAFEESLVWGERSKDGKPYVACSKCVKPLDVSEGEWVAEFPDRDTRGYHIPRLVVPGTNLQAIIEASQDREAYKRTIHYNKDLGLPYAPEEGRLSQQALAAAQREFTREPGFVGDGLVTMGVDVATARALNVRISLHLTDNTKRALWVGEIDSFDELGLLMDRYSVKMCAIDHLPEGRLARGFAERFAGRVYLVAYTSAPGDVLRLDEEQRRATVRRVEAIDSTMEMIRSQRNHLPLDLPEGYVRQMQAANRVVEQDELGKITVAYRSTGPDDYLHAEVYDLIATELWWIRQQVEEAQREVFMPLDEMLEFKRASFDAEDEDDVWRYDPGPDG